MRSSTVGLLLSLAGLAVAAGHPELVLPQGTLRGSYGTTLQGRQFEAYWGIPYAKPPVGKHRFKESVPAGPWLGVLNATSRPPDCLQYSHMDYLSKPVSGQEDCLYLNVFTPKERGNKVLDVIVYIHGGAFMFLSSSKYEPTVLLDRDLILVSINYRLGILGFLSTGDNVVPGNNGLKDQVLALKWVQSNIQAFGGDPGRVTIAGLSAGGASVHYHLLSPTTKGLFQAAIIQSGVSLNPWAEAEAVREKVVLVAEHLGCPTNESVLMVRCLRDRPAQHLVQHTSHFLGWLFNPFSPFAPIVEPAGPTAYLSESPWTILSSGRAHDVPILASYTAQEGLYPAAELVGVDSNLEYLKTHFLDLQAYILDYNFTAPITQHKAIAQKIKDHYGCDLNSEEGIKNFIKMVGDRLFVHGILKAMDRHTSLGTSPVYIFKFAYKGKFSLSLLFTDKDYGVSHADDLFYTLPSPYSDSQGTPEDVAMTIYMRDLWVDFVRDRKLSWKSGELLELRGPNQIGKIPLPELSFWDSLGLQEHTLTPVKDEL